MSRHSAFVLFAALAILQVGCAATDNNSKLRETEEVTVGRTSFSFDQDRAPYDRFKNYLIQPGDVLDVLFQIRTWVEKERFSLAVDHTLEIRFVHAPELDQTQRIRPDGTISLPYVGAVRVVGMTVAELSDELRKRYGKVLRNPELYVLVPEFRSGIKELKADLHTAPRGLSRLTRVRPDGYVTLPMVGDTFVAEKTIPEVNKYLNEKYEEILPGLHCDLFLHEHAGSVIYLLGEVKIPGSYSIDKPISVLQALARAGSHTDNAELESVMVMRKNEGEIVATRVNVKNGLDFTTASSAFYLQPDDIVFVPKTHISRSAELARHLADIVFFRGWNVQIETIRLK